MKRTLIFGLLTVIWCAVIFSFSAQTGEQSQQTSDEVIITVSEIVVPDFEEMTEPEKESFVDRFTTIVRKSAHFFEYALLGALLFQFYAFAKSGLYRFTLAQYTASFYACTDELHQYAVSDRGCQFVDVLIDSSGALLAITISALLTALFLTIRNKRSKT